jgi:hypothetical protein
MSSLKKTLVVFALGVPLVAGIVAILEPFGFPEWVASQGWSFAPESEPPESGSPSEGPTSTEASGDRGERNYAGKAVSSDMMPEEPISLGQDSWHGISEEEAEANRLREQKEAFEDPLLVTAETVLMVVLGGFTGCLFSPYTGTLRPDSRLGEFVIGTLMTAGMSLGIFTAYDYSLKAGIFATCFIVGSMVAGFLVGIPIKRSRFAEVFPA